MKQAGYSLLEVCLVLAILSFCYLLAVPAIQAQIDRHQSRNLLMDMAGALYLASNEARTHKQAVYVHLIRTEPQCILVRERKALKTIRFPKGYMIMSNFSQDRIVFYGDGQVSQAGTISIFDRSGKLHQLIIQLSSGRFWIKHG